MSTDYTIEITPQEQYLHVTVQGVYNLTNLKRLLTDIYAACIDNNMNSVLVEDHLTGASLDIFELFDLIILYSRKALSLRVKFAYVDIGSKRNKTVKAFAEQFSHIKGIEVKTFSKIEEAEQWLITSMRNVPQE